MQFSTCIYHPSHQSLDQNMYIKILCTFTFICIHRHYFIWQVTSFYTPTILHDGWQCSAHHYSNFLWGGVQYIAVNTGFVQTIVKEHAGRVLLWFTYKHHI